MAHVLQVGAGSGGIAVLDLIARDPRVTRLTLIEPDVYKLHNVERHLFPMSAIGRPKAELATAWLAERRPELQVRTLVCDLLEPGVQRAIGDAAAEADVGVCAADNERAKYHWDALMRRHRKPWTLGEVLSGGIGGLVHRFTPDGACYGCASSFLQRSVRVENERAPDYSQPAGPAPEVTIPASAASIHSIASLHALVTLEMIEDPGSAASGFTSLLLSLRQVPGVFAEAFHPYRFRIPRAAECLICRPQPAAVSAEELDVALDEALVRLGDA
jgi:molybdopterin/thiamine biosynthesis adenylyltransferase